MISEIIENTKKVPLLLRQIVDEAYMLDEAGQEDVLRKKRMQRALKLAQKADVLLDGKLKKWVKMKLLKW